MDDLRDLTEYVTIMLMIQRLEEYITLAENPDVVFVKERLKETENRIRNLTKSADLNSKRKLKLRLYDKMPVVYNKKIRKFIVSNE